ncbi:MAG: GntR family transcriptional regulator, partial [Acidimicrobiia bacterium]|nr:GntR family transcriptional regulator [Acidimicrobiia bacterium]
MVRRIEPRVEERTARGIAVAIGSLISDGALEPGDKLPTVRALASELGVSVNTVSDAWRILQSHGVIVTERRRGTTVRSTRAGLGGRYWQVPVEPGTIELDLSTGTPDNE